MAVAVSLLAVAHSAFAGVFGERLLDSMNELRCEAAPATPPGRGSASASGLELPREAA